jgi:hypothetical protein
VVEAENYAREAQCNVQGQHRGVACMEQKRGHGVACLGGKNMCGTCMEQARGTRCGMHGAKTRVGQEFDVKPVSSPTDSGSLTLTHHTPSTPSQATRMQEP